MTPIVQTVFDQHPIVQFYLWSVFACGIFGPWTMTDRTSYQDWIALFVIIFVPFLNTLMGFLGGLAFLGESIVDTLRFLFGPPKPKHNSGKKTKR